MNWLERLARWYLVTQRGCYVIKLNDWHLQSYVMTAPRPDGPFDHSRYRC